MHGYRHKYQLHVNAVHDPPYSVVDTITNIPRKPDNTVYNFTEGVQISNHDNKSRYMILLCDLLLLLDCAVVQQ